MTPKEIVKLQNALQGSQKISQRAYHKKVNSIGIQRLVRSISGNSLFSTQVGTSTYVAPEQETTQVYDEKVDNPQVQERPEEESKVTDQQGHTISERSHGVGLPMPGGVQSYQGQS